VEQLVFGDAPGPFGSDETVLAAGPRDAAEVVIQQHVCDRRVRRGDRPDDRGHLTPRCATAAQLAGHEEAKELSGFEPSDLVDRGAAGAIAVRGGGPQFGLDRIGRRQP